jgi:Leucine-rich repeat (LRR) protein
VELNLRKNELTSLSSGLFESNTKVERIDFSSKLLKIIGAFGKLKTADSSNFDYIDMNESLDDIQNLEPKLSENCE